MGLDRQWLPHDQSSKIKEEPCMNPMLTLLKTPHNITTWYEMHLLCLCIWLLIYDPVCLFPPVTMGTDAALAMLTMCFTVLLNRGTPSTCSKCIFYVVRWSAFATEICLFFEWALRKQGKGKQKQKPSRVSRAQFRNFSLAITLLRSCHTHAHRTVTK